VVKSVETRGTDVYGPLGTSLADYCYQAILASGGIFLEDPLTETITNLCQGGEKIGSAGILVK
jgi:hypothetical protein